MDSLLLMNISNRQGDTCNDLANLIFIQSKLQCLTEVNNGTASTVLED
jgi:hypothetical protein